MAMNLASMNAVLRSRAPGVHSVLKASVRGWMQAERPWPPVPRRIHGRWFWIHPRLLTERLGTEEKFVAEWALSRLPRGGVFFDVGAHWGIVSLMGASIAGRVTAFEPSPLLASILRYHCRVNRLAHIEVVERVVTKEAADAVEFYLLNEGNSYRNSLTIGPDSTPFVDPRDKKRIEAPAVCIDSYCEETGSNPNLIKIDVEGAEQWVLEGTRRTLEHSRPVLIVSLHEYWMPAGHNRKTVSALLRDCGYRIADERTARGHGVEVRDILAVPN